MKRWYDKDLKSRFVFHVLSSKKHESTKLINDFIYYFSKKDPNIFRSIIDNIEINKRSNRWYDKYAKYPTQYLYYNILSAIKIEDQFDEYMTFLIKRIEKDIFF